MLLRDCEGLVWCQYSPDVLPFSPGAHGAYAGPLVHTLFLFSRDRDSGGAHGAHRLHTAVARAASGGQQQCASKPCRTGLGHVCCWGGAFVTALDAPQDPPCRSPANVQALNAGVC